MSRNNKEWWKIRCEIRATAPSIHFIKANVLTEITACTEEQAKDLIGFI